jgi:branched-chain amino acid transport system ATP-binding protein
MALLEVRRVVRSFGGVRAVDEVSMSVDAGQLHGVIGPNGAGKSTLFKLVSGHVRPDSGTIAFGGQRIEATGPAVRARLGIAMTFQAVHLFRGMSVLENAMVGGHAWTRHGFLEAALRLPRHWREEPEIRRRAMDALARVGLARFADAPAEALPLGRQRALQIARSLCQRPRLLLLDEPTAGLRDEERAEVATLLTALRDEGLTMLLVEHDMGFVGGLADRVTVLETGRVIAEGTPAQVREDERVVAAYLGSRGAADMLGTR